MLAKTTSLWEAVLQSRVVLRARQRGRCNLTKLTLCKKPIPGPFQSHLARMVPFFPVHLWMHRVLARHAYL